MGVDVGEGEGEGTGTAGSREDALELKFSTRLAITEVPFRVHVPSIGELKA